MEAKLFKGKFLGTTNVPNADYEKEIFTLVNESESMSKQERNYWKKTFPHMTEKQVDTLFEILIEEKKTFEKMDMDFQELLKSKGLPPTVTSPEQIIRDISGLLRKNSRTGNTGKRPGEGSAVLS